MDSHRLAEWNLMSCSSCCRLFQKWQGLPWHEWLSHTGGRSTDSVIFIYCFIQAASKTKWKLCSRLCVQPAKKTTAIKMNSKQNDASFSFQAIFQSEQDHCWSRLWKAFVVIHPSDICHTASINNAHSTHTLTHTHTRVVCLLLPPLCFNYCHYRK